MEHRSHPRHSASAMAWIRKRREDHDHANWFDVGDAYDAGMKHALEARRSAQRVVKELETRSSHSATAKADGR